ncbi:putative SnoaL-like aldol condensation-catalyzing enzyme [Altererythrobacter atlanticus]|uniref:SnoaL-like domain protein n=1 Tax=Croceibacterium atlanticum TaxID=1267766 RepID=A0A0F7KTD2_9SPHN|nr:nuclear transport factor 2 family protein [Croceibacterium atlanticum]AKH42055.1 SnoaL-like domain protein [Croceibacterium atlanticum]MBB5733377.1 putative SnoaL-like aldol condensation-catalyzing enzyme [Croceibacterium atlanticum]
MRPIARLVLAAPLLLLAACSAEPASEISAQAGQDARLEANKQLVLDMWHEVIDGRNIDAARKYMAEDYRQNSPSAPDGLEALIAFLHTEFPDSEPLEPGTYPLTNFEFVIAEGDLVQLMFQREIPDPDQPGETVPVWWYDTYRVQDGKIVEHWDSAIH